MGGIFEKNVVPERIYTEVINTPNTGQTYIAPNIIGGTLNGVSYRSGINGARLEIFPTWDPTIAQIVYNSAGTQTFRINIDGDDTGDVIMGDYSGGQGAMWDNSTTSFDIAGTVTATAGEIGGWTIISGYIYSLASGTPTVTPSDGIVMASGNEALIVYENTEKRVEVGYLSAGVYGIKVYADDGSTVIFEASDTQKTFDGAYIGALSITGGSMANNTITATQINALTITASEIANNTITAGQITASTITATEIANNTITAGQIVNATITTTQIAANTIVAGNIAATTITASEIANNTITAGQITASTITTSEIADNTIIAGNIAASTITTSEISGTAGIIGGQIANLTIAAGNITNLTITGGKIANTTVTGGKLVNDTITGTKLKIGNQSWSHDLAFSSTDLNTVSWALGTITMADGTTTYSIAANNTDARLTAASLTSPMNALCYIYLDIAISVTELQCTYTAGTAVGDGKILIAIAKNSTTEATFQVYGGIGGIAITGGDIESASIVAAQIASNAIEESKILADAITAAKINVSGLDGTTGNVSSDHIIAGMIQTNAITSVKILADAITAAKINVVGLDGTSGRIVVTDATDANTVTGGVNSHATTLIEAGKIVISSTTNLDDWRKTGDLTMIDGGSISTGTVTATQVAANTITASEIGANVITASEIFAGTITTTEIAANTIVAGNIAAATITGTEIAATTIAAANIAANTITSSQLTTGAFVTATANITDAIITNAKINDLAVSKLTAGTISSQSIVLGIAAGTGDVEIRSGISTGDFANSGANNGFIFGMDDSDGDKVKFYWGNASAHFKFDGTDFTFRGVTSIEKVFTAGEAITVSTVPVPVFIGDLSVLTHINSAQVASTGSYSIGKTDTNQKMAQSILETSDMHVNQLTLTLGTNGTPTDTLRVAIQSDSGGNPDGTTLISTILQPADLTGEITIDMTEMIWEADTTYWIVLERTGALNDSNYYTCNAEDSGGSAYSNGLSKGYSTTYGGWSVTGGAKDLIFKVQLEFQNDRIYLSDANDATRDNFIGFLDTTTAREGTNPVILIGIESGFTGLTPNSTYYVQDAIGTIGTSAGSTSLPVGLAISTTEILIDRT